MLPINPIREPRKSSRPARAEAALNLLTDPKTCEVSDSTRWGGWRDFHSQMSEALDPQTLMEFQADSRIAPQICGGGGETYLRRLRDRFGQSCLDFFLSIYEESLCGNPQDIICVDGCYITRTAMRHLYHVASLHQFCKNYYTTAVDFVEVGGGFGNVARLAAQLSLSRRYFILDYPAALCIQYYYLTEWFDETSIAVWTGSEYLRGSAESKICLVLPRALSSLSSLLTRPVVMVSTMAITEMPPEEQQRYLNHLNADAVYVFGQTQMTAMPHGKHLSVYEELSNAELFLNLVSTYHTVDFRRGDYYTEFLGLTSS